uniref:Core clamp protein n=1 Tax=Chinook aquareovirus TaxID=2587490 RepID=A0A5B9N8E2_9REOV|nr:MAG: core clamp protein [Chinook aquareovirus]
MARNTYVFLSASWFGSLHPLLSGDDLGYVSSSGGTVWGHLADVIGVGSFSITTGQLQAPALVSRVLKLGQLLSVFLPTDCLAQRYIIHEYHGVTWRSPAYDSLIPINPVNAPIPAVPVERAVFDLRNLPRWRTAGAQMLPFLIDATFTTLDTLSPYSPIIYLGLEEDAANLRSILRTYVGRSFDSIGPMLYAQACNGSGVGDVLYARLARLLNTLYFGSFFGLLWPGYSYYGFYFSFPRETKAIDDAILMLQHGGIVAPLTGLQGAVESRLSIVLSSPIWMMSRDFYSAFLLSTVYAATMQPPLLDDAFLHLTRSWTIANGEEVFRVCGPVLRRARIVNRVAARVYSPQDAVDCNVALTNAINHRVRALNGLSAEQNAWNLAHPNEQHLHIKPFLNGDMVNVYESLRFIPAMQALFA